MRDGSAPSLLCHHEPEGSEMRRRYWIALGVGAVAVATAASAVAATKLQSPAVRRSAIISDAARRLHVTPAALAGALQQALDDQVDAAIAAGRMTKAQGDALKARIDAGHVPLVRGFRHAFGSPPSAFGLRHERPGILAPGMFGAGLRTVTSYLGITPAQLRTALASGKSLAQIATEHGKAADGLVAALVAAAKTRLDRAIKAKILSPAQEQSILNRLRSFLGSLVNRTLPAPLRMPQRPGPGFGSRNRRWIPPTELHPSLRPSAPSAPQL